MTTESITAAALALPPEERTNLVETLIHSLDEPVAVKYWDEWQQEIENRLAAYDRGEMPSYSREAAMRILDQDASQ